MNINQNLNEVLKEVKTFLYNYSEEKADKNLSSTAVRLLLSDEFYENFKNDFYQINAVSKFIYNEIYRKDDKKFVSNVEDEDLTVLFFQNRPKNNEGEYIWTESYWQYEKKYETVRKEGIKLIPQKGYYLKKEFIKEHIILEGSEFQNVELTYPTHKISQKENEDGAFHWIYGKYRLIEDYHIRFYWNFNPIIENIIELTNEIQKRFDNSKIPFDFKFLASIQAYNKCSDVAVLYLPRKHALLSFEIVRDIYQKFERIPNFFHDKSPMFTYKLEKGLSFGENPDDRRYTSFGSYRSIHLAIAFFLYKKETGKFPETNEFIIFFEKKYPNWLNKFHVNQFSEYDYRFEIKIFDTTLQNYIVLPYENEITRNKKFKEKCFSVAIKIAEILVKEAFWYNNDNSNENYTYPLASNWISFKNKNISEEGNNNLGIEYAALDETFLEGRMGTTFFLAQISSKKESEIIKRTYQGAFKGILEIYRDRKENDGIINTKESFWIFKYFKNNYLNYIETVKDSSKFKNLTELYNKSIQGEIDKKESFWVIKQLKNAINILSSKPINTLNSFSQEQYFEFKRQKNAWRDENFTKLIDKVITTNDFKLTKSEEDLTKIMISDYFDVERPFGNALGTDEFCATIKDGYACLGYFFLRLYDPITFKALPFKITYV